MTVVTKAMEAQFLINGSSMKLTIVERKKLESVIMHFRKIN